MPEPGFEPQGHFPRRTVQFGGRAEFVADAAQERGGGRGYGAEQRRRDTQRGGGPVPDRGQQRHRLDDMALAGLGVEPALRGGQFDQQSGPALVLGAVAEQRAAQITGGGLRRAPAQRGVGRGAQHHHRPRAAEGGDGHQMGGDLLGGTAAAVEQVRGGGVPAFSFGHGHRGFDGVLDDAVDEARFARVGQQPRLAERPPGGAEADLVQSGEFRDELGVSVTAEGGDRRGRVPYCPWPGPQIARQPLPQPRGPQGAYPVGVVGGRLVAPCLHAQQ